MLERKAEQNVFHSLGVDVGTRMAKTIGLVQNRGRLEIHAAMNFALPPDLVVGGVVTEPKTLGRILRRHLDPTGWSFPDAVFSIPTNLAVLRWVSLPNLSPEELRSAARFKVRRHLPFPVDEAYVEATQPICEAGEELGTCLVIAVRKSIVASRAQALLYAGLNPIRAELEAQAILRVIERKLNDLSVLWRDASLTIIDVGGSNTHMYVVQNQRLQFMRGVNFGANMLAKAVADATDLPFEEANDIIMSTTTELRADGLLTFGEGELRGEIDLAEPLEKLTREFLRLLRYFRSLHPERSYAGILDHAIICGGLAGLRGLSLYLAQCLALKVETAKPIAGVVAKFNSESFQSISNRQEAMTTVMGLALSGIDQRIEQEGAKHAGRDFVWTNAA